MSRQARRDPAGSITRRAFIAGAAAAALPGEGRAQERKSPVAVVHGRQRKEALAAALGLLDPLELNGREVLLKGSFNSADEFPATTSAQMLGEVVAALRARGAGRLVLLERSGMGRTREIWTRLGISSLAARLELELVALDELAPSDWRVERLEGSRWSRGVEVPARLTREAAVVEICTLKTHRFGGWFSCSLKNAVGLVAKYASDGSGHNYMAELHASADQRRMIAEINPIFTPALVVVEALQAFVEGGPEQGDLGYPEVVLAGRDRVAIDAAGIALLRIHGAAGPLARGAVFDNEQIKRAAELDLGVKSAKEIDLRAADADSRRVASQIAAVLDI